MSTKKIQSRTRIVYILQTYTLWVLLILLSFLWASYAIYMGVLEILKLLGYPQTSRERALPVLFIIHALIGVLPLVLGSILIHGKTVVSARKFHKKAGIVYVFAVFITALLNIPLILTFAIPNLAKVGMLLLSITWFMFTFIAYTQIRKKKIKSHKNWMYRSYAITLFFITFSLWMPFLQEITGNIALSYNIASFTGWLINLLVVEIYLKSGIGYANTVVNKLLD